jgi:hypothetical protein
MAHVGASNTGNRQDDFKARIQRLRDAKDTKMMDDVERCATNEGRSTKVTLLAAFVIITTIGMSIIAWFPYWVLSGNDLLVGFENNGGLFSVNIVERKGNMRGLGHAMSDMSQKGLKWTENKSAETGASGLKMIDDAVKEIEGVVIGHHTYLSLAPKVCDNTISGLGFIGKVVDPSCSAIKNMQWVGLFMIVGIMLCIVMNIVAVVYAWLGQRWHKVKHINAAKYCLAIGTVVLVLAFVLFLAFSFQWYKFMNFGAILGNEGGQSYIPWGFCTWIMLVLVIFQIAACICIWCFDTRQMAGVKMIMDGMCIDEEGYGATESSGYYDANQQDYGYNNAGYY